ncbi:MAG: hypothetical protein ACRDTD_00320 [Pseudonocardiaceae bacterium]
MSSHLRCSLDGITSGNVVRPVAGLSSAPRRRAGHRGARDPKSRTGEAIWIVGYSPTAARVLIVVLLPHRHPPQGRWHVVTAWPTTRQWREAYAAEDEES